MALTEPYPTRHSGGNVKHFHSGYRRSGGRRSYTGVKKRRQEAKPVAKADKASDGGEKRRQGLAGTGRRRDKNMAPSQDRRPCVALRRRWFGESLVEPRGDRGMKCLQWHERLKSL